MANTTYGSPYAQSADLVSAWPATSLSVADRIDDVAMKGNGINAQTGTTYTTVLTDAGKTVTASNASAVTITIPASGTVDYEVGTVIRFLNIGAGALTIAATGGVTINNNTGTTAQYGVVSIQKTATNTWYATPFSSGSAKATVSSTTGSPTITTVSGKTCYKFTGTGTIIFATAGTVDVLIVSGGGSGATASDSSNRSGGGGGAGGYIYKTSVMVDTVSTYPVTIGAGGAAAGSGYLLNGNAGNDSRLGYISTIGGGRGEGQFSGGSTGGSGGGSTAGSTAGSTTAIYPQGYAGGTSTSTGSTSGGGGGGSSAAGYAGGAYNTGNNGRGGAGTANSITGSSITYAAGGWAGGLTGSPGAGTANSGNGGDGGGITSSAGGSGVIIILVG